MATAITINIPYKQLETVSNTLPKISISNSWWDQAVNDLNKLLSYPENDTSWSPRRPLDAVYSLAVKMLFDIESVKNLPLPRIAATSEGGARIGWRNKARELDIEIMASGSIEYLLLEQGKTPEDGEIDLNALKPEINRLLNWFTA